MGKQKTVMLPKKGDISLARNPRIAFEHKWDGTQGRLDKNRLINKDNVDYTLRIPEIMESAHLISDDFKMDGEIVVLNEQGGSDFNNGSRRCRTQDLAKQKQYREEYPAVFMAYELTELNGENLEQQPYEERKRLLQELIMGSRQDVIRYVPYVIEGKQEFYDKMVSLGEEGVVAKQLGSKYIRGEMPTWRKVKHFDSDRVRVIGYTEGQGRRTGQFGAVLLARDVDGELIYYGSVGSGFNYAEMKQVTAILKKGETDTPLVYSDNIKVDYTPVDTSLEVTIKYQEITEAGVPRIPSIKKDEHGVNMIHWNDPTITATPAQTSLAKLLASLS